MPKIHNIPQMISSYLILFPRTAQCSFCNELALNISNIPNLSLFLTALWGIVVSKSLPPHILHDLQIIESLQEESWVKVYACL